MMLVRLNDWVAHHRNSPTIILYYRDGVSVNQYDEVIEKELPSIQAAVTRLTAQLDKPVLDVNMIAVILAKRHSMHFFPRQEKNAVNNGNCRPGYLVYSMVMSPHYPNFYLQSHNGIKGTARSTHYFVLHNGIDMSTVELEDLLSPSPYHID
jgi:eukaryotic translation initiation factor 2C